MKKLLIIMLAVSLLFAAGCGKKDQTDANDASQTQVQQPGGEGTQDETGKDEQNNEQKSEEEQNDVDVSNVTGEELDSLVETFNSETASEEEKEAARIKLEAIFKQAEANQQ